MERVPLRMSRGIQLRHARTHSAQAGLEQLLAAAALLQLPADPPLKNPSDFTLIGKPTRRADSLAKATGTLSSVWTRGFRECSSPPWNVAPFRAARRCASTPTR